MFWHTCGGKVEDNDEFCPKCGERIARAGGGVATITLERPSGITILASLDIVVGVMGLLALVVFVVGVSVARSGAAGGSAVVFVTGAVIAFLSSISIVAGAGLLKLKPYGRTLQIVLACFGLIGFPLWTIVSGLTLYYLSRPGVKLLFSGRPPEQMTAAELAEIRNTGHGAAVAAVTVLALIILSIPLIGIVAAIAIPGLLRARQAGNEASAIGRVQMIIRAETVYAASNGGFYDTLDCLVQPGRCLPAGPGEPFLSREGLVDGPGYSGTLYPGETVPNGNGGAISPSSLRSFAYVEVPVQPSAGTRAFCGDATGTIRFTPLLVGGDASPVSADLFSSGRCPDGWPPLTR